MSSKKFISKPLYYTSGYVDYDPEKWAPVKKLNDKISKLLKSIPNDGTNGFNDNEAFT